MTRRIHHLSVRFATALLSLAIASATSAGWAQDVRTGASFGLFGARVEPTDSDADVHTEAYGLRGGYRFGGVWAAGRTDAAYPISNSGLAG